MRLSMQYAHHAGYAFREFYARNPRLAPKSSTRHKRLAAYALIALMLAGTVACIYLRPSGVGAREIGAHVPQLISGYVR